MGNIEGTTLELPEEMKETEKKVRKAIKKCEEKRGKGKTVKKGW